MNDIRIISQKTILKDKLFEVKEIEFVLPNAEKRTHRIVERHPTVSVFPLTDSYELYLVSQYRYVLKKVTLEAMAGFVNKGETMIHAAQRELIEETGISATQWEELMRIEMSASVFQARSHLFLAKGLEHGVPHPEEGEEITVIKMSLEEAVHKVLIGEINHSASMIGILILDKLRQEGKI